MKRHQICRMIPGGVLDAQLRREIADLGLPADADHDYRVKIRAALLHSDMN